MSQNLSNYNYGVYPQQTTVPNAVAINIFTPQAYGTNPNAQSQLAGSNQYNLYGPNSNVSLPLYPANYNNFINPYQYNTQQNYPQQGYNQPNYQQQYYPQYIPQNLNGMQNGQYNGLNDRNMINNSSVVEKTQSESTSEAKNNKKDKKKVIVPLSDEYIKSVENYLNDANPKIRLIGAKNVLERFKEDENRKDNPSLTALLNKVLRDTSPAVRFLGLTTLQVGYALGNNETVQILKEIQATNQDKFGQDSILASEILLRMSAPQAVEIEKGGN